jgi:hypothetical protein
MMWGVREDNNGHLTRRAAVCPPHPADAAVLAAMKGNGSTIRSGHSSKHIVWREGFEAFAAAESYDRVAAIIYERLAVHASKSAPLPA